MRMAEALTLGQIRFGTDDDAGSRSIMLDRAREILKGTGGGELTSQNKNGLIIDSDTVAPGNDPNPPRDRK